LRPGSGQPNEALSKQEKDSLDWALSALGSRTPADRILAAAVLQRLGPKAKAARGSLCAAMLCADSDAAARAAAAPRAIDPQLYALGIAFRVDKDMSLALQSAEEAGKLKEGALVPIILRRASTLYTDVPSSQEKFQEKLLCSYLVTLVQIAPGDAEVAK